MLLGIDSKTGGLKKLTIPDVEDINTILNGSGAPASGVGEDNDFYIDTADYDIYGPKSGSSWGSPTSLIGPQGEQGPPGDGGSGGEIDYDNILPWKIDLEVFTPAILQTGTWANLNASTELNAGQRFNSSAAQNDEIGWDLILAEGTWRIDGIFHKTNSSAIASVRVDGSQVGSIDLYNATTQLNQSLSVTGISIASTGKKRVSLRASSKNASSSSYIVAFSALSLTRTA